jgi:hypothetical protein
MVNKTFKQKRSEFLKALNGMSIEYKDTQLSKHYTLNGAISLFDKFVEAVMLLKDFDAGYREMHDKNVVFENFIYANEENIPKMSKDFKKNLRRSKGKKSWFPKTEKDCVRNQRNGLFNEAIRVGQQNVVDKALNELIDEVCTHDTKLSLDDVKEMFDFYRFRGGDNYSQFKNLIEIVYANVVIFNMGYYDEEMKKISTIERLKSNFKEGLFISRDKKGGIIFY